MWDVALAGAQIGASILGGKSAEKKAKAAAEQQAKLTLLQREEEISQRRRAAKQQAGQAKAAIGASNIQFSGSSQRYMRSLNYENMREIAFAQEATRLEQRAIMKGAQGAGGSFFAQAAGDAIGLAANMYATSRMNSMGGGWGSTPGTVYDSFLNQAEAGGAFDGSF